MSLLNSRGKFYVGTIVSLYCPNCLMKRNHRVFYDTNAVDEKIICASCKRVAQLPEEYRMKELRQPMLYKDLE